MSPNMDLWHSGIFPPDDVIRIYTDGSNRENRFGGGFYIENFGIKSKFRLPDFSTALQAEITAIIRASNWLRCYRMSGDICIFTDSKAAVNGIAGVLATSRLTQDAGYP